MTAGQLLTAQLDRLGLHPGQVRTELERRGVRVRRQTVQGWCADVERPTYQSARAVLDLCAVPAEERDAWLAAFSAPPSLEEQ